MKKLLGLISTIGLLITASTAQAHSPYIMMKNFQGCPDQLAEFRQALEMDADLGKFFVGAPNNQGSVNVVDATKKPVSKSDAPEVDLRSSPDGVASWTLNPSVDAKGNCVPVKATDIVQSLHDWEQNQRMPAMQIPAKDPTPAAGVDADADTDVDGFQSLGNS
jgi:hypothetical protein